VASKLRKMRQGQRFKARLNKRPSGQIHCSQLLQQNRPFDEVAASLHEVRLLRHGRPDLLTFSSSYFDPQLTFERLRCWAAPNSC
ncbi:hypothetical protein, partial [Bradyrhizobium sp. CW4]|uniref:hypothetical protein n=1 Tax=Bradyrhizobium sp. CW4 TaxID=2782687 RepID=UPI001FFA6F7E